MNGIGYVKGAAALSQTCARLAHLRHTLVLSGCAQRHMTVCHTAPCRW